MYMYLKGKKRTGYLFTFEGFSVMSKVEENEKQ